MTHLRMPIYESIRWTWNLHYCCNIYLIKFVEVNIGRSQCLCRLGRDKQNNQDPEIERPIEIVVPNLFQVQKYESTNRVTENIFELAWIMLWNIWNILWESHDSLTWIHSLGHALAESLAHASLRVACLTHLLRISLL